MAAAARRPDRSKGANDEHSEPTTREPGGTGSRRATTGPTRRRRCGWETRRCGGRGLARACGFSTWRPGAARSPSPPPGAGPGYWQLIGRAKCSSSCSKGRGPRGWHRDPEMDGHALALEDGSFDMAGSQFGVMLFPDMPQGIREMARIVISGGRVLMIAYGDPHEIEFLGFLVTAIRCVRPDFDGPPMDPPPLPFQLQSPDRLRDELAAARLRDISVETITEVTEFDSGAALWDWLVCSNPIVETILADLALDNRRAWRGQTDAGCHGSRPSWRRGCGEALQSGQHRHRHEVGTAPNPGAIPGRIAKWRLRRDRGQFGNLSPDSAGWPTSWGASPAAFVNSEAGSDLLCLRRAGVTGSRRGGRPEDLRKLGSARRMLGSEAREQEIPGQGGVKRPSRSEVSGLGRSIPARWGGVRDRGFRMPLDDAWHTRGDTCRAKKSHRNKQIGMQ